MSRPILGLILATFVLTGLASPAAAEWRRAESPRFIVYSDGSESDLRAFVQKLETFDRVLRISLNRPLDALPNRKFPLYLVRGRAGLNDVRPNIGSGVAGVYFPAEEDIFAVAIREQPDDVLLHEYAHHFMFQEFSGLYPGWLIEGFAEYYATADIDPGRVSVGAASTNRVDWLAYDSWIELSDLVSKRYGEVGRNDRNTYYPVSWLLTHWFLGDRTRNQQLEAYLTDIRAGGDPREALTRATGLSPNQIQAALRRYFDAPLPARRIVTEFPTVAVEVAVLPPSADDLLLIGQRLKIGVADDQRAATAAEVRRRAARHGDDPFAQLQLGHAELHFGDAAEGEAVLNRLLEREPDNVEALQLLATRYLKLATDEPDNARAHLGAANRLLARALAADERDYRTYMLLGRLRERLPTYPTANDVTLWQLARDIAPQVNAVTMGLAGAYLRADRAEEAIAVLLPLANAPHGGGASEAAEALLERARSGETVSETEIEAAEAAGEDEADEPEGDTPPPT